MIKKAKVLRLSKRVLAVLTAVASVIGVTSTFGNDVSVPIYTQAEETLEDYEEQIEEYQEKQEEYDALIAETEDDIAAEEENQAAIEAQIETVQATIYEYSKMIAEIQTNLDEVQESIDTLNEQIEETEATIEQKQAEIEEGISDFKLRLRAMYIAGDDSYVSILFGSTDFYDALMRVELINRVAEHDDQAIDDLVQKKNELEEAKATLEDQKAEVEVQKEELEEQKETYNSKKAEQQSQMDKLSVLVAQSQAQIEALEADKEAHEAQKEEYAALEEEAQEMWNQLYEEAEAKRKAAEEEAKRLAEAAESSDTSYDTSDDTDYTTGSSGSFIWPLPGHYVITYGVGYRWGSYHAGIDIADSNVGGAQIVASDAGTVVVAENTCTHNYGKSSSCGCGGGYGRYCIVDHGNGYMTLYAHMTNCIVTVGQTVEQGETLGYVGSTGFSTGNHLHFEVRKDGTAVNPENYVSP
ncbi:MAG: peptidoglycan DD-metalloendopeptidase family protein [Ruminococcus sp.]|nr:peptidoglycan DD-metalloendopeptidase family protein [Ruminococcus sp.]